MEVKLTAFDKMLPPIEISPPFKETEANSPLLAVPIEERVIAPVPAVMAKERKSPVTASRAERVTSPPPPVLVSIVRFVLAASDIDVALKEIEVLALFKVVVAPLLKMTEGTV